MFLFGILTIPLQAPQMWQQLSYSNTASNQVSFSSEGLSIHINKSSSPLIYIFEKPSTVVGLTVRGSLLGLPHLPTKTVEGVEKGDDFPLRVGLVCQGDNTVSWLERLFAPSWLKQLLNLFPDKKLEKIQFFNIAQQREVGFFRTHPKSRYIEEEVILKMESPGPFSISHSLKTPMSIFALWIQCDGDDSQSVFDVKIKGLELVTEF